MYMYVFMYRRRRKEEEGGRRKKDGTGCIQNENPHIGEWWKKCLKKKRKMTENSFAWITHTGHYKSFGEFAAKLFGMVLLYLSLSHPPVLIKGVKSVLWRVTMTVLYGYGTAVLRPRPSLQHTVTTPASLTPTVSSWQPPTSHLTSDSLSLHTWSHQCLQSFDSCGDKLW